MHVYVGGWEGAGWKLLLLLKWGPLISMEFSHTYDNNAHMVNNTHMVNNIKHRHSTKSHAVEHVYVIQAVIQAHLRKKSHTSSPVMRANKATSPNDNPSANCTAPCDPVSTCDVHERGYVHKNKRVMCMREQLVCMREQEGRGVSIRASMKEQQEDTILICIQPTHHSSPIHPTPPHPPITTPHSTHIPAQHQSHSQPVLLDWWQTQSQHIADLEPNPNHPH